MPFVQQRQVLWYLIDHLQRFCGAALEQHGGRTPSFKNQRILDLFTH